MDGGRGELNFIDQIILFLKKKWNCVLIIDALTFAHFFLYSPDNSALCSFKGEKTKKSKNNTEFHISRLDVERSSIYEWNMIIIGYLYMSHFRYNHVQ